MSIKMSIYNTARVLALYKARFPYDRYEIAAII